MAFSVPTLGEVVRTVENGFSTAFYGSSGVLRVTVLKLLAKVIGAAVYLPLLCCRYIWQNSFVSTADAESLCKIGADYSLPHKPATYAHGYVTFIGGTAGVKVPAGTVLVYETSGCEYETLEDVTLANGVRANVRALDYGSESNLPAGGTLKLRDGVIGGLSSCMISRVDGGRSVSVQVGSGSEDWGETLEEYRARLKFRKQNQPQGGCGADYVGWCKRFDFVTDVWCFPNWPATNNVSLFIADGYTTDYTVSDADLATVRAYVNDASRKPLCSAPLVASVSTVSLEFTVTLDDIGESNRTSVLNALKAFLRCYGPGDTIQKVDLQAVASAASGDATAIVSQIKVVGGSYYDSYTLPKSNNGSVISGSIVNLNSLDVSWNKG